MPTKIPRKVWRFPSFFELSPGDRATTSMASKLALRGAQVSPTQFHSRELPYCDEPVLISRQVRSGETPVGQNRGLDVSMLVPCRKCEKCLLFRQLRWRDRARSEIEASKRSWFVTLTFSPTHLAGIIYEASLLKVRDRTKAMDRAAYAHVKKYLKRLRKAVPGLRMRYLAVFELGEKTGRAHYHLLIHECGTRPVTKRILENKWRSNVHARLVADSGDAAAYLNKITRYATKDISIPPRASLRYGFSQEEKVTSMPKA